MSSPSESGSPAVAAGSPEAGDPVADQPAPDSAAPPIPPPSPPLTPLLTPRDGVPEPVRAQPELSALAARLASNTAAGPVALDAERASGFRYSQRAYLVQLRRPDVGTVLLDPIPLGGLAALDEPLSHSEWVLHAATQDLPCLADAGLRPRALFDTELAGRLAGFPRVGLGPLVERMLGLSLEKGHGAADWSQRPLPASWLNYAALDVEVLLELRDAMADELSQQGKLDWAREEFRALLDFAPSAPRAEPWRRTSGIHRVRDRRTLAVIQALWTARDSYAADRDIAPHRVLPDAAIIAAAIAKPTTEAALSALPLFAGRGQRRQASRWLAAIGEALRLPDGELPVVRNTQPDELPPLPRWKDRNPAAADRLAAARERLTALSEQVSVPLENLISPELVRRVAWFGAGTTADVAAALRAGGAREWQLDLVSAPIAAAVVR